MLDACGVKLDTDTSPDTGCVTNGFNKSICANVNTTGCDAAASCYPNDGVLRFIADSVASVETPVTATVPLT